jgi:hypothetical protein
MSPRDVATSRFIQFLRESKRKTVFKRHLDFLLLQTDKLFTLVSDYMHQRTQLRLRF